MIVPLALLTTALACAAAPPPAYVPEPELVDTGETLVGAWMCPLWRQGCRDDREWQPLLAYPERQPLLGWYDEGSPEVTDWEIAWARSHGISFFVPCWFRAHDNLGQPVRGIMEHWVQGLASARYRDQIRFAILWENLNPIACGVASEADLLDNLLPYWLQTLFSQPNYLVLDGKPVLFIYSVDRLIQELGGQEEAARAIAKMSQACREADFQGLTLIGVHHQNPDDPLDQMAALGLDATSSYHWPTFSGRMPWPWEPAAAMAAQEDCWQRQESAASLPSILTVSVGWDDRPWGGKAGWQLSPEQFGQLCARARERLTSRPGTALDSRLLLIDNWNEFGEGHYILPCREHGFAYLDALRAAFCDDPAPHTDLVPEDLGLGPYDSLLRATLPE